MNSSNNAFSKQSNRDQRERLRFTPTMARSIRDSPRYLKNVRRNAISNCQDYTMERAIYHRFVRRLGFMSQRERRTALRNARIERRNRLAAEADQELRRRKERHEARMERISAAEEERKYAEVAMQRMERRREADRKEREEDQKERVEMVQADEVRKQAYDRMCDETATVNAYHRDQIGYDDMYERSVVEGGWGTFGNFDGMYGLGEPMAVGADGLNGRLGGNDMFGDGDDDFDDMPEEMDVDSEGDRVDEGLDVIVHADCDDNEDNEDEEDETL